jgi:hypothetical protein
MVSLSSIRGLFLYSAIRTSFFTKSLGMVDDVRGSGRRILNVAADPWFLSRLGFILTYAPTRILISPSPHVLFSGMDPALRRRQSSVPGCLLDLGACLPTREGSLMVQ